MNPAEPIGTRPGGARFLFIDLFRTIIILLMLEGHVLRQFVSPEARAGVAFYLHEIFHGITAPAFLFGAGLTFVISSHRRWTEYHRWSDELERRLRRIVLIFLLGIFLHLPYFSFRKTLLEAGASDILVLFQSDVLTCISAGLLSLHLLLFFFRREDRFHGAVVMLLMVVVLVTPIVWDVNFLHFTPVLLAQLSNSIHGSPFPLFPFLGYLFAGVAVSRKFVVAVEAFAVPRFMRRLALGGALSVGAGFLSTAIPFSPYPTYDFWYTSPSYFLIRLGILFVAAAAIWWAGERIGARIRPLLVLGKESLFVYVLHLLVLYGSVINPGFNLVAMLPASPGGWGIAAVFTGVGALMYAAARSWQGLKQDHPAAYRIVQAAVGMIVLYLFFTRDY